MDKETIIIDGVNVAECISFDKNNGHNICCYDDTREDKIPFANFCVENKNCYYKQLKRLEQENGQLKKDFSSYEDDIEDWVSDNSILYQYDDRTPDTLEELQACMESVHEQWQKYKQAIEEIREYCNKIEQGKVIGTQDCFVNSIKNIINYTMNEVSNA